MKDWKYFKYYNDYEKRYILYRYTKKDTKYNIYEDLEIWIRDYKEKNERWIKIEDRDSIQINHYDIEVNKLDAFKIINNIQTRKED